MSDRISGFQALLAEKHDGRTVVTLVDGNSYNADKVELLTVRGVQYPDVLSVHLGGQVVNVAISAIISVRFTGRNVTGSISLGGNR